MNKRLFRSNKYLPSKSRICIYAEKFKLRKPIFTLTELNPGNAEWISYKARLELDNKVSEGSGRTKRKAEAAASCKYLNNVYLAGGNSLQLGNPVSAPHTQYPPGKKRKDRLKVEKMIARKRAEAAAKEAATAEAAAAATETGTLELQQPVQPTDSEEPEVIIPDPEQQVEIVPEQPAANIPEAPVAKKRKQEDAEKCFVSYDIERSSGADDSEIINLSYASERESGQFFIKPMGGIDKVASAKSSKIRVHGDKMFQDSKEVKYVSLEEACSKFVEFVEKVGGNSGVKPILVCHGNDLWTLMNNMAFVGLDQKLLSTIGGSMNFKDVVNEEENLEGKSKSLTSLDVSENLSEIILGKHMRSEIRQHAHDAEFDAKLLLAVMRKYLDSKSDSDYNYIMKNFVRLPSDGLASICKEAIQMIGLRRMRRKKKVKDYDIVYIYGWGQ